MAVKTQPAKPERTLTTLGLVVVGFFWTSGGFYGSEVAMDGPPLYVLIICLAMPLLYSLPTALISAELATNYPETGGQSVYVSLACGDLIGAHNTWWVWFSTACDAAIYPQYVRDSIRTEFGDQVPDEVYTWLPTMIVVAITAINIAGVDWLIRFQTILSILALLPCLVILGFGFPKIKMGPLISTDYEDTSGGTSMPEWLGDIFGNIPLPSMISRSLWLYGGFTNLGVLAGEAITPRRSYLIAVAVLVPLKILLRFVPFIIAYSVGSEEADFSSAGYFATVARKVASVGHSNGEWLRWWYFAGSILCFFGFYNAMAVNAERTAFFFCEERFATQLTSAANKRGIGAGLLKWLFSMPGEEGGIRRIYILAVGLLELGLIWCPVGLLIELEMLIYALSAGLFFYAYLYLRFQRTRMFKIGPSNPDKTPLLGGYSDYDRGGVDAEIMEEKSEIFNVGGGNVVACLLVIFPVTVFALNTFMNLVDSGVVRRNNLTDDNLDAESTTPFPYFKLAAMAVVIFGGIGVHIIYHFSSKSSRKRVDTFNDLS